MCPHQIRGRCERTRAKYEGDGSAQAAALSALKANAAADGGVVNVAKAQAWKEKKDWKQEPGKGLCDLLMWALSNLTDDNGLPEDDYDGMTLRQLITDGMGAAANSYLDRAIAASGKADKAAGVADIKALEDDFLNKLAKTNMQIPAVTGPQASHDGQPDGGGLSASETGQSGENIFNHPNPRALTARDCPAGSVGTPELLPLKLGL